MRLGPTDTPCERIDLALAEAMARGGLPFGYPTMAGLTAPVANIVLEQQPFARLPLPPLERAGVPDSERFRAP